MKTSCPREPQFTCKVHPSGRQVLVEARDEVDVGTVAPLEELLRHVVALGVSRLVIDVRPVTFLDLAGARVVLEAVDRARSAGSSCTVVLAEGPVARLFRLLGFELGAVSAAPERRCGGRTRGTGSSLTTHVSARRNRHPRPPDTQR